MMKVIQMKDLNKEGQRIKIALNLDGTLKHVEIHKDTSGENDTAMAAFSCLKKEILEFSDYAVKKIAMEQAKNKPWWRKVFQGNG